MGGCATSASAPSPAHIENEITIITTGHRTVNRINVDPLEPLTSAAIISRRSVDNIRFNRFTSPALTARNALPVLTKPFASSVSSASSASAIGVDEDITARSGSMEARRVDSIALATAGDTMAFVSSAESLERVPSSASPGASSASSASSARADDGVRLRARLDAARASASMSNAREARGTLRAAARYLFEMSEHETERERERREDDAGRGGNDGKW